MTPCLNVQPPRAFVHGTEGIKHWKLPVGTRLKLGENALVEVTQIGKEWHDRCVMPGKGVFVRVIRGGAIKNGDDIVVLSKVKTPIHFSRNIDRKGWEQTDEHS